ncbi:MAG TPA: ECF-type sigma factor, partial [Opitutaceae bacterium]
GALDLRELPQVTATDEGRARTVDDLLERIEAEHPGLDLAAIIEHYAYGGLGQEELAAMLGINARTVRRRLLLVKELLERSLQAQGAKTPLSTDE